MRMNWKVIKNNVPSLKPIYCLTVLYNTSKTQGHVFLNEPIIRRSLYYERISFCIYLRNSNGILNIKLSSQNNKVWVFLQQPHIWKIYLSAEPSQYFVSFGFWLISWTSQPKQWPRLKAEQEKKILMEGRRNRRVWYWHWLCWPMRCL